MLVRADSAFHSRTLVTKVLATGANVSITARMDKAVRRAIATIDEQAWTQIKYTDAIFDQDAGRWVSRAEVAEMQFTAFISKTKTEQVLGRLIVRRIPDRNPKKPP